MENITIRTTIRGDAPARRTAPRPRDGRVDGAGPHRDGDEDADRQHEEEDAGSAEQLTRSRTGPMNPVSAFSMP
jgi:hypothetical protein